MFHFSSIGILCLPGTDLIFFMAACMIVWQVYLWEKNHINSAWLLCLLCCLQCQGFLSFLPAPVSLLGVNKKMRRDTTRTADPQWSKEYPTSYGTVFSNKNSGKECSRDNEGLRSLISQTTIMDAGALLLWNWASMWPNDGK